MLRRRNGLLIAIMSLFFVGMAEGSNEDRSSVDLEISGRVDDCVSEKTYHPSNIDIFIYDAASARSPIDLLNKMQRLQVSTREEDAEAFFALYAKLEDAVRKNHALAHVKTDADGRFTLRALPSGHTLLVVAIGLDVEDEGAYYNFVRLVKPKPGTHKVTMTMNSPEECRDPDVRVKAATQK